MKAPHTTEGRGLERWLDFSIGRVPLRLLSSDEPLLRAASARYSAFAARQLEPSSIFVEGHPGADSLPREFTYEFEGSAVFTEAKESRFTGVRNEYALDSLLRVLLSWKLLSYEGFLLHAATIMRNGKAYVFTGRSGAGKSTAAAMSPEGSVLTDEISLLRREDGVWRAYGTPFWGEFKAAGSNTSAPVAGIYRLFQAFEHEVTPLSKRETLRMLLPNVLFFSADVAANQRLLEIASSAAAEISCYQLAFRKDPTFWEVVPA
ncbi:MAG TPA: hypothetical protein VH110_05465 [Candidatus Acidoferrum sp.]|nr:hypothetical protein [Candidatus Acidoferrum sp.]